MPSEGEPDDEAADSEDDALAGSAAKINIGFNGAAGSWGITQFKYFPTFFNQSAIHPGPRICHTYVHWNLGLEKDVVADASADEGSRPAFTAWLKAAGSFDAAEGHRNCDDVLVSFKGHDVDADGKPLPGAKCSGGSLPPCAGPGQAEYKKAVDAFLAIDWKGATGFDGTFSFTPWNEPNNPLGPGNGLGKVVSPEKAATYYLTLAKACEASGCTVAAGDFASNGNWWDAFEWNCADDNAVGMTHTDASGHVWCNHPSSRNPGNHREASYLDRYKNYIALHAKDYQGVKDRPGFFAFHGWHDANEFLDHGSTCDSYDDCALRRILQSLGGSWGQVKLWDTEVGASQGETVTDAEQAKVAAFILRLHSIDSRLFRIYYTRLNGGGGDLVGGSAAKPVRRPALCVLADRKTSFGGEECVAP